LCRDKPPFSFVMGQDSTMWDIVWVSPQEHRSVSVSHHFLLQAPQCPCCMWKQFSRDHCCRERSKPGCRIVVSHTRWELTTLADIQLCLHRLLMSAGCKSSHRYWWLLLRIQSCTVGFHLAWFSSVSSEHFCIFDLCGALYIYSLIYLSVNWACWDWLTNHCPSALWRCWLGHLTRKIVWNDSASSGMLNRTILYHYRDLAIGFQPPSATVVSAELFSHGTWTLRCLEKEMATYRHWSVSLWQDPNDVPHCKCKCKCQFM